VPDNTTLPGTGEVYASDDIAGVKHQRVKISLGLDGSAADWRLGVTTSANAAPVVLASDQAAVPVTSTRPATATLSNVAASVTSVTVLASNAARYGATVQNDSSAILYLKFGAAASTTSYTVQMAANSYYEVPFGYTGILAGLWVSATGSARVTEITA